MDGATKPPWGCSSPTNSTRLERSVPNSGYWRVVVVAIRAPETDVAHSKAALRPGAVKLGSA